MQKKYLSTEYYEKVKNDIRETQDLLHTKIGKAQAKKEKIRKKIDKLKNSNNQSKEFKLTLKLNQINLDERNAIEALVNKITKYEKELYLIEKYLNIPVEQRYAQLKEKEYSEIDDYGLEQKETFQVKSFIRRRNIKGLYLLLLGSFITTIGFDYFLAPANILPTGVASLGRVLGQYIFPPTTEENITNANSMYYIFYIVTNLPLIIFSFIKVSPKFTLNTLLFMVTQTCFHMVINGVGSYRGIPKINSSELFFLQNINDLGTDKLSLAVRDLWTFFFGLIGGILIGIGSGLIYFGDGSPGGTDFVNMYISRRKEKEIGNVAIAVNTLFLIVTWAMTYAVKTNDPKPSFTTFYFSAPFFTAFMVIVITGVAANKIFPRYTLTTVNIITKKPEQVINRLIENGYYEYTRWSTFHNTDNVFSADIESSNSELVIIKVSLLNLKKITEIILLADHDAMINANMLYKTYRMPIIKKETN